jgi:type II secretory pathway pseudopilin PulG
MKTSLSHRIKFPPPTGFTLIEVIGALALLALIVGIVAQSSLAHLNQTQRQKEANQLTQLARGFERAVIRTRGIPEGDGWATLVAGQLAQATDQVRRNPTGQERRLLLDPNLQVGTTGTNSLPYLQTSSGSLQPSQLRAILISSLGAPLPTLSASDFAVLWSTPNNTLPVNLSANWSGQADDLRIERIDFGRLFRRVILNNLDSAEAAPYGLDDTNVVLIAAGQRVEGWFFETSSVNLYYGSRVLQARETIARDTSYVYENGRWGRSVIYGAGAGSTGIGQLTDDFINLVTFNNTAADDPLTSDTTAVTEASASTESEVTVTESETTTTTTTVHTKVKNNNGHGNNLDGVDSSNPGEGGGGPTGSVDPSGTVDDEANLAHGTTSRDVVEASHRYMKAYVVWAMKGRPIGGDTARTRHPAYRTLIDATESLCDFTANLANP